MNPYLSFGRQHEYQPDDVINMADNQPSRTVESLQAMHSEKELRRQKLHHRIAGIIDLLHKKSASLTEERMRLERQAVSRIKDAQAQARRPIEAQISSLVSWQRSIDSSHEDTSKLHAKIDEFETLCLASCEGSMPSLAQLE